MTQPVRLVTIVGARPQFIKAAVVSAALRASGAFDERLIHTGQHYDANLSRIFFEELDLPAPDVDLGIGSGGHGAQTGRMLEAIERCLLDMRPGGVLVYGDTNSTLAGALAAAKLNIPLAHVEAGVRSFQRAMPEEINRVVTDQLADLLLTPTPAAEAHLRREGIPAERIHWVGDVMFDAARRYGMSASTRGTLLERNGWPPGGYILATIHRAENTDDPARLTAIWQALHALAERVPVVVPLHPRTRRALTDSGLPLGPPLAVIEPVGYLDMTRLERHARLIVTDSGGVQKEAYFHGVSCVVLRNETEWPELLEAGHRLVPPTSAVELTRQLQAAVDAPSLAVDPAAAPFGDGRAAERVVDVLRRHWS